MHIIWYGQSCFKITLQAQKRSKQWISLVIDPFSEDIGLKLPKLEADIVLVTHEHQDHSNRKAIQKDPFVIDGPGEYELRDVFIRGIDSFHDNKKGEDRGLNTIYTITTEEVRLCHLGDFGQSELTSKQLEEIGEVDVLMIPVGGVYTVDAKEAAKIIGQIEPRTVIPMHYSIPGLKIKLDELSSFLKVIGEKNVDAVEKFSAAKQNISGEDMSVVPLVPQSKKASKK